MTKEEMTSLNPMIASDGETFVVSSALNTIAGMLAGQNDGAHFDGARTFGLSVILETCAAALRHMSEAKQ